MTNIFNIKEKRFLLEQVIELGDENSETLGFLPKQAFIHHANQEHILVAVDKNDHLLGYLLYAINRRKNLAYIVHLCVKQSQRGLGIARLLFNRLKERTKHFRGIRVHCRRDYEVNKLWPELGFVVKGEKDGRSKQGSKLTIWWFNHNHPTIFTYANEHTPTLTLKVAIDANILIDLQKKPTRENEESHSLLADWLQEDVELCLTDEIFYEINRNKDEQQRAKRSQFAKTFPRLHSPNDKFMATYKSLRALFPNQKGVRNQSDLRQLARSIAAEVPFFVTRDDKLLIKSDKIVDKFGLRIIQPSYLITHLDELARVVEYQPVRLAGSLINIERVKSEQSTLVIKTFFNSRIEKKVTFKKKLDSYLIDPHTFDIKLVTHNQKMLALIIYERQNQHELKVPLIRVLPGPLSGTLARHLIVYTILTSCDENRTLTKIIDYQLSNEIKDVLKENGFMLNNGHWIKANIPFVGTSKDFLLKLTSLSNEFPSDVAYFSQIANFIEKAKQSSHLHDLLNAERILWPTKFIDLELPTFVVAIKPKWAKDLFDKTLARGTLFGADPKLILKVENVYYRAAQRQKKFTEPLRILWYVSHDKGRYEGSKSIRACSYVDEVIVGKPKELYARFKRFGVYEWRDIFQLAKQNIHNDIMAFKFSHTELFSTPIKRETLQEIWREETGKQFNVLAPLHIPSERFFRIYKIGMKLQ